MLRLATDDFFREYMPFQPTDAHVDAAMHALRRADVLRRPPAPKATRRRRTRAVMGTKLLNVLERGSYDYSAGCGGFDEGV
jgi:hypothetical protein